MAKKSIELANEKRFLCIENTMKFCSGITKMSIEDTLKEYLDLKSADLVERRLSSKTVAGQMRDARKAHREAQTAYRRGLRALRASDGGDDPEKRLESALEAILTGLLQTGDQVDGLLSLISQKQPSRR